MTDQASVRPQADPEVVRRLGLNENGRLRRALFILAVVGVVGAAIAGGRAWWKQRALLRRPSYTTAEVKRGDLQVTVTATGTLQALNTVQVGAEVSGRVTKVYVDYNDPVEAGQVLAVIDPEQFRAANDEASARVLAAEAAIHQAEATVEEAEAQARRAELQSERGLTSTKDLEAARAAALRAKAGLESAVANARLSRATLKSTSSKLGKTKVVSPIRGMVLSRLIETGQTVTAGFQTPVLFKLAQDLAHLQLHVLIDEADVGRIREGQKASFTVEAYPEQRFASKVLSVRNEPTQEQNVVTYEALLTADNAAHLLRPGMTATANIMTEVKHQVLLVPNAALRFSPPAAKKSGPPGPPASSVLDADGPRVWVPQGEGARPVPAKPGLTDGHFTELLTGELKPGDRVITDQAEVP